LCFCCVYPFFSLAWTSYMLNIFQLDQVTTSDLLPITTTVAFLIPLFGLGMDRFGKIPHCLLVAGLFLLSAYAIAVFGFFGHNILAAIFISTFFGLVLCLVIGTANPSVAILIEENKLGTAYGIFHAVLNGGLVLFNYLVSAIKTKCMQDGGSETECLKMVAYFMFSTAGVMSISCLVLIFLDHRRGGALTKRGNKTKDDPKSEEEKDPLLKKVAE